MPDATATLLNSNLNRKRVKRFLLSIQDNPFVAFVFTPDEIVMYYSEDVDEDTLRLMEELATECA